MDRTLLKKRAKDVLRKNYWISFFVTTMITFVSGGVSLVSGSSQSIFGYTTSAKNNIVETIGFTQPAPAETALSVAAVVGLVISSLLLIAYSIFVSAPLRSGQAKFFLEARKENTDIKNSYFPFLCGSYKNLTFVLFMKNLFVSLGSLLIIPGIWFAYAYYLVPYILAENPELDYHKALDLSKRITNGHKFEIFVMELSFIGWYLLGGLIIFGVFFVHPYREATMAEMYISLRDAAVEQGNISYDEIMPSKEQ